MELARVHFAGESHVSGRSRCITRRRSCDRWSATAGPTYLYTHTEETDRWQYLIDGDMDECCVIWSGSRQRGLDVVPSTVSGNYMYSARYLTVCMEVVGLDATFQKQDRSAAGGCSDLI